NAAATTSSSTLARAVASRAPSASAAAASFCTNPPSSAACCWPWASPSAYPAANPSEWPSVNPSRVAASISSGLTTIVRAARDATVAMSAGAAVTVAPETTRPRRSWSDDEFITASRHVDLARLFEYANRTHDCGLRFFDRLQLDWSKQLDFFGEVGRRALG